MTGLMAELVDPPLVPGSPEWRREITASKVSAMLGLSPWTSRFTIWHDLAGYLPHDDEQTVNQARGHYLEDAIARWFAEEQGVYLRPGRCWRSKIHPWMVASPDRLVVAHRTGRIPRAVVEIKTAADYGDWGQDGTDEIPPHYRAQVIWQMDCLGLPTAYVAVLLPRLAFRAYTVRYDPEEAQWMRNEVQTFLDTLPGRPHEQVPTIDSDDSTYQTLRKLHPDIEDRDVEITPEFARRFVDLIGMSKVAQQAEQEVKSEMALVLGNAKRAVLNREGQDPLVIATRQSKGSGTPFVVAKKPLPELELISPWPMSEVQ